MTIDKRLLVDEVVAETSRIGVIPDKHQWHVNHKDCPAGADTKKRLYIKRKEGTFLAYCHHCSEAGVYFTGGVPRAVGKSAPWPAYTAEPTPTKTLETHYPKDAAPVFPQWVWDMYLCKYFQKADHTSMGVGPDPCEFNMVWSEGEKRIIMPVHDDVGRLVRVLKRAPEADKVTKKVLSFKNPDHIGGNYSYSGRKASVDDPIVVVEDWVSACLLEYHSYRAYCLFGCSFTHEDIQRLLRHEHIIVLMDHDEAGLRAEREIIGRLGLFMRHQPYAWSHTLPPGKSPKDSIDSVVRELDIYWAGRGPAGAFASA